MSIIKPFVSIRPVSQALTDMLANQEALAKALENGKYATDSSPAIYIYEQETAAGIQFGIWTLTSLSDLRDGKIVTHEDTLPEHEDSLCTYRKDVGIEGSPVLLTYRRQAEINGLIEKEVLFPPQLDHYADGVRHKIWAVRDPMRISDFQHAFKRIDRVYVADGHHRLAAASSMHQECPQWITSLYISAAQLRCKEFHRLFIPDRQIDAVDFIAALQDYFYLSGIPGNIPYRPDRCGRFGLSIGGQWYQLDLKETQRDAAQPDVSFLQGAILESVLGVVDPRTDPRLSSWPADQWTDLLKEAAKYPEAILFTLFPMTTDQLIMQAEKHSVLPPKSTYIEPKIPYGLMLYSSKLAEQKGYVHA